MGSSNKHHRGRVGHLSKQQAYPIIEQYFRSGMLPKEFWEKVGWSDNQFYNWRKRYIEEYHLQPDEEAVPDFHPVSAVPAVSDEEKIPVDPPKKGHTVDIIYPNGVTLKVSAYDTDSLKELINLY